MTITIPGPVVERLNTAYNAWRDAVGAVLAARQNSSSRAEVYRSSANASRDLAEAYYDVVGHVGANVALIHAFRTAYKHFIAGADDFERFAAAQPEAHAEEVPS
ncbi:hypothetical protein ACFQ0O_03845 [Saccharopolyspora spinosporotrichia]